MGETIPDRIYAGAQPLVDLVAMASAGIEPCADPGVVYPDIPQLVNHQQPWQ